MPPTGCGLIEQVQDESGPTSEESVFVLTSNQLQEVVSRAIQPLHDRIESLESMVASQDSEIVALKTTVAEQKADYESMNLLRCEDFIRVSQRVNALQKRLEGPGQNIGKTSEKRITEIDKILKSTNGSASFKLLREKLGIKPNQFSRLITSLDKRKYVTTTNPMKPKEKILRIKARWS